MGSRRKRRQGKNDVPRLLATDILVGLARLFVLYVEQSVLLLSDVSVVFR